MKNFTIIIFMLASINLFAQTTNIPDSNFEQVLIDLGVDDVIDGHVLTASIDTIKRLDVGFKSINDLTGIEDFVALTYLNCYFNITLFTLDISQNTNLDTLICMMNSISNIDVSNNTNLKLLDCSYNTISSIDISNNTALTDFGCANNNLSSLNTSSNILLTNLGCFGNAISDLDLSQNTNLKMLICGDNNLSNLDVSASSNLEMLICEDCSINNLNISSITTLRKLLCGDNLISNLDVSLNLGLTTLNCASNSIEQLNLVTNTMLDTLNCSNNQIENLDLSQNSMIDSVNCSNNNLSSLDIRNGNNAVVRVFSAINNPDLSCIFVDDKDAGYLSGWAIDATSTFVETEAECDNLFPTYVPDDNFEQALIDLGYDDVLDNYVLTANISSITSLDVSNKNISDLTGIEDFHLLTYLSINANQLTNINISSNINLTYLNCQENQLTNIDVALNTALEELQVGGNPITSLDVSLNSNLLILGCSGTQLTNLTLNTALNELYCYSTQLSNIDISNNGSIRVLNLDSNNLLTDIDVRNGDNASITSFSANNNPNLKCIFVDDKDATYLNAWTIDATATFVETEAECDALDVKTIANNFNIAIYPNPAKETFSIKTDSEIIDIKIYNVFGKLVQVFGNKESYNVSNFVKGVYLIHVKSKDGVVISKLIIE